MKEKEYPYISDITLSDIITKYMAQFSLKKYEIAKKLYIGCYRTFGRTVSGERKITSENCRNLFSALKDDAGGTSDEFVKLMIKWYPSLASYTTESEIIEIMTANLKGVASIEVQVPKKIDPPLNSKNFLQSCLDKKQAINCVKMAYQTGWLWLEDPDRTDLLISIAESGVPIQVLANPESVIKEIAYTMREPALVLRYKGFNETLVGWHKYECAYNSIQLRISDYPILRKTVIVEFEDGSSSAILGDYAYGSPSKVAPPYTMVTNTDASFAFYKNEFDFLWDKATSFSDWQSSLPKPKETMQPNDYILLYPSHESASDNHGDWIYSALSIGENNEVKLRVNISDLNGLPDAKNNNLFEYEYNGKLTPTGKHLFISLYDDARQENINITLFHRYPDNSRFLGIMTGLSPLGQPVAFKCACIGRSAILKINFQLLREILCRQAGEWNNTLMILEQRDINLFYSQKIFTKNSSEKNI